MKKSLRMLLVLPLLVALIAGCSKPPEMEMAAADQAMQAAQATQASKYAAADWQMANDTLQAAKAEKAAQDSRFALFRSYGKSKAMFEKASALMNTATTNANGDWLMVLTTYYSYGGRGTYLIEATATRNGATTTARQTFNVLGARG